MMALLKAHNPLHQLSWLTADWTDQNTFEMAIPSAKLNICRDLMAPARAQQRLRCSLCNLIALTYRIISLVCLLIVSTLGSAIPIVHIVTPAMSHLARQLRAAKWPFAIEPFPLRVPKHPLRPAMSVVLKGINHSTPYCLRVGETIKCAKLEVKWNEVL